MAETDLDQLSNSVVSMVDEDRLDEANAACEELRTGYPEVHDWLMRKVMASTQIVTLPSRQWKHQSV